MTTLIPRAEWGARRPNGDKPLSGPAQGVYVHHTVTTQLAPDASVETEKAQMRALESIGFSRFGPTQGISYNVLVFPSGRAYEGVSMNRRGAHTDSRNSIVRSICFVGNYEVNEPTAAALETAAQILAHGKRVGWWTGLILGGHRDIKATSCPGRHVYAQLGAMNARAAALLGGAVPVDNPVPPPAGPPAVKDYVQNGDRGVLVAELQRLLVAAGFSVGRYGVDGMFGDATEAAVRAYQRSRGLTDDGVAGAVTIGALRSGKPPIAAPPAGPVVIAPGVPAPPFPLPLGWYFGPKSGPKESVSGYYSYRGHLMQWQQRMADRGWAIAADGLYGDQTERVTRAFQAEKKLAVDGRIGPVTWAAAWTYPVTR